MVMYSAVRGVRRCPPVTHSVSAGWHRLRRRLFVGTDERGSNVQFLWQVQPVDIRHPGAVRPSGLGLLAIVCHVKTVAGRRRSCARDICIFPRRTLRQPDSCGRGRVTVSSTAPVHCLLGRHEAKRRNRREPATHYGLSDDSPARPRRPRETFGARLSPHGRCASH